MSSIGLMDGAFFVGRKDILDWLNSTLQLNLARIEDTSTGAVACQLLDIMHPSVVPMHKVNWTAKQNFEIVSNYKILQSSFDKLKIDKHIDVDRLISGRYMDNLEFMQWFKRFFELGVHDLTAYDVIGQRSKGKGGTLKTSAKSVVSVPPTIKGSKSASKLNTVKSNSKENSRNIVPEKIGGNSVAGDGDIKKTSSSSLSSFPTTTPEPTATNSLLTTPPIPVDLPGASSKEFEKLQSEIERLRANNDESTRAYSELRLEMDGLEKEKDFYFDKLRDIEVMLQEIEDSGKGTELTASIFKILYATADGFEIRDADAERTEEEEEENQIGEKLAAHNQEEEKEEEELTF